MIDKNKLHELSIAYAQARLIRKQYDSDKAPNIDELYSFSYDYQFAMNHIVEQMKSYPKI